MKQPFISVFHPRITIHLLQLISFISPLQHHTKMEAIQFKVALRILEHCGIPVCLVGEIDLNYYNVPRVLHFSISGTSIAVESF